MPHNVIHEMFFSGETLLADVATVRSLARVLTDVVHHMFFTRKRFRAVLASTNKLYYLTD